MYCYGSVRGHIVPNVYDDRNEHCLRHTWHIPTSHLLHVYDTCHTYNEDQNTLCSNLLVHVHNRGYTHISNSGYLPRYHSYHSHQLWQVKPRITLISCGRWSHGYWGWRFWAFGDCWYEWCRYAYTIFLRLIGLDIPMCKDISLYFGKSYDYIWPFCVFAYIFLNVFVYMRIYLHKCIHISCNIYNTN